MTTRQQTTLFGADPASQAPLAERMRPHSVDELVGSEAVLAESAFLGRMLRGGSVRSLILWGPPGCGKTTIARLLAERADAEFETLSAVLAGIKDLREVVARAEQRKQREGRATILFVDEIHRFNKAQQDAFLPHVEAGTVILVGATTENPSFEVIGPLLSRCRVVVLEPLSLEALERLVDRALSDRERGLGATGLSIEVDARRFIADSARGDARAALGALEASADLARDTSAKTITLAIAEQGVQRKALLYDKGGEEHYNVISAFIKSMRGSDPDAAVYWLARMLEAGEDPLFIARRMVIFASEDVGLADPSALPLAIAVRDAVHFVGLPEARINLAHGVTYLALSPKSNMSYAALGEASAEVKRSGALPVPKHLRNAPTGLMRELGYGRGYVYPHGREEEAAQQGYLPAALAGRKFLKKP
jgi:putative ATPase